jgi:hypothetical protein
MDAGYPDRQGHSDKSVGKSTKQTCPEITGYRTKYSTVLWFIQLQIRRRRKVETQKVKHKYSRTSIIRLMTDCRWPDNKKSRIIEDDPYVRLSETFLETFRHRTLFRTTRFRLFTRSLTIFFSAVDIRTAIRSQLSIYNSARALKVERNCMPVRGTVNRIHG